MVKTTVRQEGSVAGKSPGNEMSLPEQSYLSLGFEGLLPGKSDDVPECYAAGLFAMYRNPSF
jgi:hypothetical protein